MIWLINGAESVLLILILDNYLKFRFQHNVFVELVKSLKAYFHLRLSSMNGK